MHMLYGNTPLVCSWAGSKSIAEVGSCAPGCGRPTPFGQAFPVVSTKYTVLTPLLPLPLVVYRTLLKIVRPRKLVSFPTLSALPPSGGPRKRRPVLGAPGCCALSGLMLGVRICAPAPVMMPSGCGFEPLPAL